jgi:glycerol-3-phosphate dehydrogenase
MWRRVTGTVDLLVVGGGVTGAGIARDASHRGLSVVLLEMTDLASGTSSRSSKLVHGGLRYLEQGEFSLVFEAVSERRILLDIAPHLVNPLGFLFPVYKGSPHKLWFLGAGMWVYEGLSLFRSPKRHRTLNPSSVAAEEPALRQEGLTGAPLYYDCSTDDARLTLESALDAVARGAIVATYAKVIGFLKNDTGRIAGAVVRDELSGEIREIHARAVVNATGPWTDRTQAMSRPTGTPLLRPTKGVHVVVDAARLPLNNAVVCFHPEDRRVLFAIPWAEQTYLGTTDTDYDGDPGEVHATLEDVDYLLAASNHYFPANPLTREDIVGTWAGLRPLIRPVSASGEVDESAVSREHQIVVGQDGLITIAGGKLTTYRRMAGEVVDTAVKLLRLSGAAPRDLAEARTDREPLPGAVGWPEDDDHDKVAVRVRDASGGALSARTSRLLADTYGMRGLDVARLVRQDASLGQALVAGRPEIAAQVVFAAREELAATVSDVLVRRTQLFHRDALQGLTAARTVAALLARTLGFDDAWAEAQVAAYEAEVRIHRRWREDAGLA